MQRKSGFLTFCFACLPGAGEMYLGYMKRGLSVMIAFWGLIFVASLLNMGILGILAPIIWAYSFFDTFNLRAQTPEQVAAYRLADNKVGELAEWDDGLLSLELDGIFDIDMGEFGFDLDDLGLTDEGLSDAFELPDGDRGEFEQMTFQLTHDEAECVRDALAKCGCGRSGEALAMVVREWLG